MDALDKATARSGAAAYVIFGSSQLADMRYVSRFISTDPIIFLKRIGDPGILIVSQMEFSRAVREAAIPVMTRADAGLLEIMKEEPDRWQALARMIAGIAGGPVLVPPTFPHALAASLIPLVGVEIDQGALESARAVKSRYEAAAIQSVQRAAEAAIDLGISMIRKSRSRKGILHLGKKPLTSEFLRAAMHSHLLSKGILAQETIVSCGPDTALPHARGSGPLQENEPVIIDIFPRDEQSGYYSDMTRTVLKGEASPDLMEMFEAVKGAKKLAAAAIKPGRTGSEVYEEVVGFFRELGYGTGQEGFTHNLGHGIGLEVHELPTLGPGGPRLAAGNVVTNEPGLYYPSQGGVRLEDIGLITRSGFRCFTRFPEDLVI